MPIVTLGNKIFSSIIVAPQINDRNNGRQSDNLSIFYDTHADMSAIYDLIVMAYKPTGTESIIGCYGTQNA
jgi:hypothetical protein